MTRQEVDDLYVVATDAEADVLDELRVRAGHLWRCAECRYLNNLLDEDRGDACEGCGALT